MSRNTLIAILLSLVIILGWNYFYAKKNPVTQKTTQKTQTTQKNSLTAIPSIQQKKSKPAINTKNTNLFVGPTIPIDTPYIKGTFALKGGTFDNIYLKKYKKNTKSNSPLVHLLNNPQSDKSYFVEFYWVSVNKKIRVPNHNTLWTVQGNRTLSPKHSVMLTWQNGQGITFEEILSVDDKYMFHVTQKVINHTLHNISFQIGGRITQKGKQINGKSFYYVHQGPLLSTEGSVSELKYDNISTMLHTFNSPLKGWIGFTSTYWLVSLIPPETAPVTFGLRKIINNEKTYYQAMFFSKSQQIKSHHSIVYTTNLFVGAKQLSLLSEYKKTYHVANFDRAIDFGWLYFLTKPLTWVLNSFTLWFGSFAVAILLLTVLIRIILFPLARKSALSMAGMKLVQPKLKTIREQYKGDRIGQSKAMSELYKKYKIQPAQGCLMAVVQVPIFFALYKVFLNSLDMRHAHFLWVSNLAAPNYPGLVELFGLIHYQVPPYLMWLNIGILPLILGATIFIQQRISMATVTDPMQRRMFMFLPIVFTFLFASFPTGLVVYWIWNNILSVGQQIYFLRKAHVKVFDE